MEKSAALISIEAIEAIGELPVIPAQGKCADLLVSEISLQHDLAFVMACCERLVGMLEVPESSADETIIQALWSAAHVAYARCFNSGLRTKLRPSDVKRLRIKGAVRHHENALALRDMHIAHSVSDEETIRLGLIIDKDQSGARKVVGVTQLTVSNISGDATSARSLWTVSSALHDLLNSRITGRGAQLLEEAKATDINELCERGPLIVSTPRSDEGVRPRR